MTQGSTGHGLANEKFIDDVLKSLSLTIRFRVLHAGEGSLGDDGARQSNICMWKGTPLVLISYRSAASCTDLDFRITTYGKSSVLRKNGNYSS